MEELKKIYERHKIKWNKFYVRFGEPMQEPQCDFEIKPMEYLKYAKTDIEKGTRFECINSMGNAKRAVESQIDLLIQSLGYDYKIYDKRDKYLETKNFVEEYYKSDQFSGITERIKLLNVLGLAPTLIISEMRNLRNMMEHEYIAPSIKEVKKAIEVAELFINSSTYKFSWASAVAEITNNPTEKKSNVTLENLYYPKYDCIKIIKHENTCEISLYEDCHYEPKIEIDTSSRLYIKILYSLLNEECYLMPSMFGFQIDQKFIQWNDF